MLQPITRGIIMHRQWVNRLMLNLVLVAEREGLLEPSEVGEVGEEPTTGVRYRRKNRAPGTGSPYAMSKGGAERDVYSVLTPEAIHKHGVGNDVMLSNMTPQAKAQMIQVMALAIGQKILSRGRPGTNWASSTTPIWRTCGSSTKPTCSKTRRC